MSECVRVSVCVCLHACVRMQRNMWVWVYIRLATHELSSAPLPVSSTRTVLSRHAAAMQLPSLERAMRLTPSPVPYSCSRPLRASYRRTQPSRDAVSTLEPAMRTSMIESLESQST